MDNMFKGELGKTGKGLNKLELHFVPSSFALPPYPFNPITLNH